jgi:hypothetical protein
LILDLKIVGVTFCTSSETKTDEIYLISSFLCGFSERFAEDIISRAGLTISGEISEAKKENDSTTLPNQARTNSGGAQSRSEPS